MAARHGKQSSYLEQNLRCLAAAHWPPSRFACEPARAEELRLRELTSLSPPCQRLLGVTLALPALRLTKCHCFTYLRDPGRHDVEPWTPKLQQNPKPRARVLARLHADALRSFVEVWRSTTSFGPTRNSTLKPLSPKPSTVDATSETCSLKPLPVRS